MILKESGIKELTGRYNIYSLPRTTTFSNSYVWMGETFTTLKISGLITTFIIIYKVTSDQKWEKKVFVRLYNVYLVKCNW